MGHRRILVAGLLAFLLAACAPPEPAGSEPRSPADAAAAAGESAAGPAGEPGAAPAEVEAEKKPMSLRFVSPNRGPATGGNEVTIDGRGFREYPRVHFGGVQAWIVSVTPTEIRISVPPAASADAREVDVTVTNPPTGTVPPVSATLVQAYSYVVGETTPDPEPATAAPAAAPSPPPAAAGADPSAGARVPAGPALVARFRFETSEDSGECPPFHAIRFTDRSTGAIDWLWNLGDGETSTERNPEHCYSTPGMRSVTLTVNNGRQSASASEIVIVGMD